MIAEQTIDEKLIAIHQKLFLANAIGGIQIGFVLGGDEPPGKLLGLIVGQWFPFLDDGLQKTDGRHQRLIGRGGLEVYDSQEGAQPRLDALAYLVKILPLKKLFIQLDTLLNNMVSDLGQLG